MKYVLTCTIKNKTYSVEMENFENTDSDEFLTCVAQAIVACVNQDVNSFFNDITSIMLCVGDYKCLRHIAELDKYAVFRNTN